jgi:[ribosomal protein S5]-alanine N-acetyltransferase
MVDKAKDQTKEELEASTVAADEEDAELAKKIANLAIEPAVSPVMVPLTSADVKIWNDFMEYRKNRRNWDTWRQEEWGKHHPPHIHELFKDWPILETHRLRLRLIRQSDAENAFRVLSNTTTMKFYGSPPHKTIEQTQKDYIDLMIGRFKYRDAASFVVTFKDKDDYIGHVNASQFDREFKFVELAYIIDPEHWGKGIATEAVGRVVEFLVHDMKIHKIRAGLFSKNLGSKRVLEKLGFQQEGYCKDNAIIDGEYVDEYLMALIGDN